MMLCLSTFSLPVGVLALCLFSCPVWLVTLHIHTRGPCAAPTVCHFVFVLCVQRFSLLIPRLFSVF